MYKKNVTNDYLKRQTENNYSLKTMKTIKLLLAICFVAFTAQTSAQTADEIIANYYENTGGLENWEKVEGLKMFAKINQGGMEIPLEITQLKDGRQATVINFQGQEIKQGVFDGEVLWSTNFMTKKAEKSDAETTANMKVQSQDFPDSYLNYKEKGYTIELMENEEVDGTECYKIKITRTPLIVDGKEEANVAYHLFDMDNFVPIAIHAKINAGPAKGQMSETILSDYQEVDGLYFPFSMTQGIKGQPGQPITLDKIELNPKVDDAMFAFPEEAASTDDKKN